LLRISFTLTNERICHKTEFLLDKLMDDILNKIKTEFDLLRNEIKPKLVHDHYIAGHDGRTLTRQNLRNFLVFILYDIF
jgi:hypothetical protein